MIKKKASEKVWVRKEQLKEWGEKLNEAASLKIKLEQQLQETQLQSQAAQTELSETQRRLRNTEGSATFLEDMGEGQRKIISELLQKAANARQENAELIKKVTAVEQTNHNLAESLARARKNLEILGKLHEDAAANVVRGLRGY